MINILVESESGLIKDYDKDFMLFNNIIVGSIDGAVDVIYSDLSSATCNIHQVEDEIVDFIGNKYLYSDGVISENPDYQDPEGE